MAFGGALLATAAVAVAALGGAKEAKAFPKFSQKEKKPCSYCHVNPAGGGKRTAAGEWYDKHGYSLAGFQPGATPAPAATPAKAGASPAKPATPAKPAAKSAAKKPAAPKKPATKKQTPPKKKNA